MYEDVIDRIKGHKYIDEKYLARCIRELKRWNAPLSGWECADVVDVREDDKNAPLSECDLCGCTCVRYEHHMEHADFPFPVVVGCICAGIMEGDILKAKERERLAKNRSARRRHFIEKKWRRNAAGAYVRRHRKQDITIIQSDGIYQGFVGGEKIVRYKGMPITSLLAASYAAFNAADPEVKPV